MRYVFVGEDIIFPVVSPAGKQRRRNAPTMVVSNICKRNSVISCRNMVHLATSLQCRANSVLLRNLPRWRAADSRPYADCATELPTRTFRGAVGAAISRPVVSPLGKQRRRIAPTMQYHIFANEIHRYNVETWYILQHCYISGPNRFCPEICHIGGWILYAPAPAEGLFAQNCAGSPFLFPGINDFPSLGDTRQERWWGSGTVCL